MEEKVRYVLKLVEEDADSFAERAEMYYKKRPELIHFVEEAYRAYRALAERYDHLSAELQNANHVIASVFPDQVRFAMDNDEYGSPSFWNKTPENLKGDIPVVPKLPLEDLKAEGSGEIDKLHKRILALQTEKEFAKICSLEDEFGESRIIEEHEARNVMAATSLSDIMLQLKELKKSNAMKDNEILSLRRELNLSRTGVSQNNNTDQHAEPRVSAEKSMVVEISPSEGEVKEHIGVMLSDQSQTLSEIEEKFRVNIDELLNENLDFWFRFSTAVQEIPKFENGVKDLQAEISELDERRKKQDGSGTVKSTIISDVRPLYKHLIEVQSELNGWVERSLLLEDELKNRFSSLCDIQEEITKELKASAAEDEFRFTSYQAAKFQGEILNMKQENNKVAEELQAGLDDARTLQLEVERTLAKLREDWEISGSKINRSGQLEHSDSPNRVPLRSFIFGVKPKKQKTSIFARVHPALRKYTALRSLYSSK
ncbi:hypothetical protein V6N13_043840 [Hibiscus sabdariffa]|uniref:NAB domain-containing protein n=1 Tax=Hibiscus sabdariffa TaxID=183260 RepID=A0ABR2RGG5_9ROSI